MKRITIHCSATPVTMAVDANVIRRWHLARGWSDIGYHWVVNRDGRIEAGRSMQRTGAHVRGHNHHNIGVCLVGGVSQQFTPENNFTKAQWDALAQLIVVLSHCYNIPFAHIRGHRDYDAAKACPCFDVGDFINARFHPTKRQPEINPS
ncbi:N-acetylmuramoyl-L-alanine amidase [Vibrio astriarenae]|uniref:N-acetylmuramoyl-L-alanine amidase n=1 Tax=Vibrio astriarenae TaxID=1481923 RepID=UPI003736B096